MSNTSNKIMAVLTVALMLAASFVVLIGAPVSESSCENASAETVSEHAHGNDAVVQKLSTLSEGENNFGWIVVTNTDGKYTFKPGASAISTIDELVIDRNLTILDDETVGTYTLKIPAGVTITVKDGYYIDFVGSARKGYENLEINGTLHVVENGVLKFDSNTSKVVINGTYATEAPITSKTGSRTAYSYTVNDNGKFEYKAIVKNDFLARLTVNDGGEFTTVKSDGGLVFRSLMLYKNQQGTSAAKTFTNNLVIVIGGHIPVIDTYYEGKCNIQVEFINNGTVVVGGSSGPKGFNIGDGDLTVDKSGVFKNTSKGRFIVNAAPFDEDMQKFYFSYATVKGKFINDGSIIIVGTENQNGISPDTKLVVDGSLESYGSITLGVNGHIKVFGNCVIGKEGSQTIATITSLAGPYSPDTNDGIYVTADGKLTVNANTLLDTVQFVLQGNEDYYYSVLLLDGVVSEKIEMSRVDNVATVTGKVSNNDIFGILLHGVDIKMPGSIITKSVDAYVARDSGKILLTSDLTLNSLSVAGDIDAMFRSASGNNVTVKISAPDELYNVSSMSIGDLTYVTGVLMSVSSNEVKTYDQAIYLRSFSFDGSSTGIKSISASELWTQDGSVTGEKYYDLTKVKVNCESGWSFEGWYEIKTIVGEDGNTQFVYQKVTNPSHYTASPGTTLVAKAVQSPAEKDYTAFFITLVVLSVIIILLIAFVIYKRFFSGQA